MYEVFLNERKIIITQPGNTLFIKDYRNTENLNSLEEVQAWFQKFLASGDKTALLFHTSPDVFWRESFLPAFNLLPAAGGVVIKNNKILFINRLGKWDLPKGKIDTGETAQEAALREVEEECGINGHKISNELPSTFHIYQSPYKKNYGQWILKETHWFEMSYNNKETGIPQTEENISEIRWFRKNELGEVLSNTYDNLKKIILLYSE